MQLWQRQLSVYSRSRSALWKAAIGIVAAAALLALLLGPRELQTERTLRERISDRLAASPGGQNGEQSLAKATLAELGDLVQDRRLGPWEILKQMPLLASLLRPEEWTQVESIIAPRFGTATSELAADYLGAAYQGEPSARRRLEDKASRDPPKRYANRILAEIALRDNLKREAAERFAREGAFPEAEEERVRAVGLLRELGAYQALDRLMAQPRFEASMTPQDRLDVAARQRRWLDVARFQLQHAISGIHLAYAALALVGGCVWGIILFQMGQLGSHWPSTLGLAVAAFLLGAISTLPTVFLDLVMVERWGLEAKGELLHDLAVNIASVGLREELCKLLLFLPLAPILIRRGRELEMLAIAGFVGLGFAVEENTVYFEMSGGLAGPARLLTANFFHIGMTGLCGLYLCRWLGRRGVSFSDFFYVFGLVVIAHGLYDALLSIPELGELSLFAYSVYILLSLRFFAEAHELRAPERAVFSLTGTFAVGASLFLGVVLLYLSRESGLADAVAQLAPSLLGVGIIALMFFREFREDLYE